MKNQKFNMFNLTENPVPHITSQIWKKFLKNDEKKLKKSSVKIKKELLKNY